MTAPQSAPTGSRRASVAAAPLSAPWNAIVVVPAHDESDRVEACVRSVLRSIDAARDRLLQSCVVVVADKCQDATAAVARRTISLEALPMAFMQAHVIEIENGNVGTARAIGVAFAQQAIGTVDRSRTWVANTDADTCVPANWMVEQLRWADAGVVGVAGVVTVDTFAEHPPIVAERFHATYTARLPDDSRDHEHVHGANLGVRLDAYLHAGGWQQLELSEDHDLWNRMRAKGLTTRSPSSLQVVTSGRATSRCPGGFADALCAHRLAGERSA